MRTKLSAAGAMMALAMISSEARAVQFEVSGTIDTLYYGLRHDVDPPYETNPFYYNQLMPFDLTIDLNDITRFEDEYLFEDQVDNNAYYTAIFHEDEDGSYTSDSIRYEFFNANCSVITGDPCGGSGMASDFAIKRIDDSAPAVPEPATWAMLLTGFAGIGYSVRRSRVRVSKARYG